MSDNTGKYIAGSLMILLGIGIYFAGTAGYTASSCTGWSIINPLCWGGKILDFGMGLLATIGAIFTAIFGILIIALPSDRTGWIIGLYFFSALFIVTIFVPDPLPIVDELLLGIGTALFGIKSVSPSSQPTKIDF